MTVSVRVETNSTSGAGGQRSHDLRIGKQPDYVDSSRSHLNSTIVPCLTPKELSKICLDRRVDRAQTQGAKRQPRSMKKDATIMIAGIITFGKEAQPHIRNLPDGEQNELFRQTVELVAKELGTTVAGLVVHRDESAPHAHFQLPGYGVDGSPISKKINLPMCSKIQDIGAKPFNKIGIHRGERVSERRERGEDYSKTIHRSVRQLHSDLPKELEAAQEKVAEMESRVEKTEGKLAEVREKLAQEQDSNDDLKTKNETLQKEQIRLEKRLKAYEKRLQDREAELTRLAQIGKEKPEVKTGTLVEMTSKNVLGKESIKSKKEIKYVPADGLNLWYGGVLERHKKAKQKEKEALEKSEKAESELKAHRETIKKLNRDVAYTDTISETRAGNIAAESQYEMRYSVIVQRTPELVRVPPQAEKTPRQIASALYRVSRDNFGSSNITFRISSDEIAQQIIAMAIEDDAVMSISFNDSKHQEMLQEAAEKALEEGQMGKKSIAENPPEKPSKEPSDDLNQKSVTRWSNDETNPKLK